MMTFNRRFFIGLSVLVCLILGIMSCAVIVWYKQPLVEQVEVSGVSQPQQSVIKQTIQTKVHGNWFFINLTNIKSNLEQIPSVDKAVVKRGQPFKLKMDISPQRFAALWNQDYAINPRGELFKLPKWCQKSCQAQLPKLKGEKSQHRQLLSLYQLLQSEAKSAKLSIEQIDMDQKGIMAITLENGLKVIMGGEDNLTRWHHFVTVYSKIFGDRQDLNGTRIDLRYPNGMAVHWGKKHG